MTANIQLIFNLCKNNFTTPIPIREGWNGHLYRARHIRSNTVDTPSDVRRRSDITRSCLELDSEVTRSWSVVIRWYTLLIV